MEPNIAIGFLWFVAFLFSTTVHEAMHALVAWKGGDPTAYHGGQVSLSPIPHIRREPIGMVVVPLLTALTQGWALGWASTPYDPYWAARHPKRAALMSAAGPAGNLMIAGVAFALLKVGLSVGMVGGAGYRRFEELVTLRRRDAAPSPARCCRSSSRSTCCCACSTCCRCRRSTAARSSRSSCRRSMAQQLGEWSRQPMFQMIGLLVAWRVFPMIARPLFALVLKAVHPSRRT